MLTIVETGLYKALREIGRIAKTAFLLDYFTQRQVRRQVQRGLNLQESIHALARARFIGQRGELRLRDLDAQLHRISCLQLVMAMVITWNAALTCYGQVSQKRAAPSGPRYQATLHGSGAIAQGPDAQAAGEGGVVVGGNVGGNIVTGSGNTISTDDDD